MKRYFLLFIIALLANLHGHAQTQSNCYTMALRVMVDLPKLYKEGKMESVDSLLTSWERECGRKELTQRLRTLLEIQRNDFREFDFDLSDYNYMFSYLEDEKFKLLMDSVHENPQEIYLTYFTAPDLIFSYTDFTKQLASTIAKEQNIDLSQPVCDTKTMLLQLYSGKLHPFLMALKNEQCTSAITRFYTSQLRNIENKANIDIALMGGIWMPYGNMQVLGNHPSFGFLFGWGKQKMIYDFVFDFRFGKPRGTYEILYNGVVTPTNYYFGAYLGGEVGYALKAFKHATLYALGGAALDGFDAIEGDVQNNIDGKSLFALNLNAGLGWRFFNRDGSYTGLEVRHNFVNYNTQGGTKLDDNTVSVRVLIGLFKNDMRKRELAQLKNIVD